MARQLGVTVVDKTGLKGSYDFMLSWMLDENQPANAVYGNEVSDPTALGVAGASIFTALEQQLGLKLVPQQGPVETLVIDHIEQPSEQ